MTRNPGTNGDEIVYGKSSYVLVVVVGGVVVVVVDVTVPPSSPLVSSSIDDGVGGCVGSFVVVFDGLLWVLFI